VAGDIDFDVLTREMHGTFARITGASLRFENAYQEHACAERLQVDNMGAVDKEAELLIGGNRNVGTHLALANRPTDYYPLADNSI